MIKPRFKLMKYLLILTSVFFLVVFSILAMGRTDEGVEVRGEVVLKDSHPVFSPASGFVDSIPVEEGEVVKKDQLLVSLRTGQELERIEVLSPAGGLIYSIDLDSLIGKYVRKGEILTVICDPYQMRFRALVPEKSIPFVKQGLEAIIFIDAFPYQRFGTFAGVVSSISPAPESKGDGVFYAVTLLIENPYVESETPDEGHRLFLKPKMKGKARIMTQSSKSILGRLIERFFG
jgi:multidrug resistance efflux pump